MKSLLKILAKQGDISPLSYFFASFIAEQSTGNIDGLLAYSAALVSENNQAGDVCINMNAFVGQPLFSSEQIPRQDLPCGIDLDQWCRCLLESPCVGSAGEVTPLILEDHRLYLNRYWLYETRVAELIRSRLLPLPAIDNNELSQQLGQLFPDGRDQTRVDAQMLAVALAANRRFVAISGGPGTGKTTTVLKILSLLLLQQPEIRIELAAPTGKAAARMMESIHARIEDSHLPPKIRDLIPRQASTIHRLLGYRNHRFYHSSSNPLALDCLVIDEASMLDLTLAYRLLDALPARARIILLGDRDQLASVAAGNVLGDITGHGQAIGYSEALVDQLALQLDQPADKIPRATEASAIADSIALLTKSYRFGVDSGIGQLASLVNRGASRAVIELLQTSNSSVSLQLPAGNSLAADAIEWILSRYTPVLASTDVAQAMDAFDRSRVLCAIHSGPFGVDEMNRLLSHRLQATRSTAADDYHGRPILITANDYELNLFNGDTGLLWPDEAGVLRACFRGADGIRELPIYSLPEHVTAWAMTVHKSQGSEFESVLLILPTDADSNALTRELLYTGVTRARKHLRIHSSVEVLVKACENLTRRGSGLARKLGWKNL
ncbi:MAG: exodeoxyribonuclease V subunit alpha [Gammaproteobacteria bacterium]|nr:exodeoxyribonuclease V subunit alpha [Gammaproteobacteria bacterium]